MSTTTEPCSTRPTPGVLRLIRLLRLMLHFTQGLASVAIFPLFPQSLRNTLIRSWSRKLLNILNIHVHVTGDIPNAGCSGAVLVANHISWIDIWLIDSNIPSRFVAKADVQDWPLMGWLASKAGTLFIQRERRHHTAILNTQVAQVVAQGERVVIFPEGTTSNGRQIRPFFTSLLQPAVDTGVPLLPVAIRYVAPDGSADLAPAFIDDITFAQSLARIVAAGEIRAEVMFLPPIDTTGKTRRELARAAEGAIAAALSLPVPGTKPETTPDPQAA